MFVRTAQGLSSNQNEAAINSKSDLWRTAILDEVNRIGTTFDMKKKAKKTKTMLVCKDVTFTKVSMKIDGDIIKQTDNYTYFGQIITPNGKWIMRSWQELKLHDEHSIRCWKL